MFRRRLGKKVDRKERKKAAPEQYPDEGPCPLAEAYGQLSRPAFAIWIRMSVAPRAELRIGRAKLSRLLGYSRRQGDELLRELERKGFVTFIAHGPYRRTVVVITRKPLLEQGHSFTRFSALLFSPISEMHFRELGSRKSMSVDPPNSHGFIRGFTSLPKKVSQLPEKFTQLPVSPRTYQCPIESLHKSMAPDAARRTETGVKMVASTPRVKRRKFVAEDRYFDESLAYRDLIGSIRSEELERRRLLRSSNRARRDVRNAANRARGIEVLDWNDLDVVTFDPRRSKHRLMCTLLARKPRDPERAALVKRLETEFCRLYTRYRRAAERASGRPVVTYEVTKKERKYAAAAGALCVQRGVTPRQLMEFWHANLKHFRRAANMQVPTLSFLSGPANIDTVACGLVLDETAPGGARIGTSDPEDNGARPKAGNSFSDTTRLDARLRKGLEGAGFSTRELNDRYLLTVQKNALGIANGRDIFIGKGSLRDMSLWAARTLYAK
jgi:hypothetical protein